MLLQYCSYNICKSPAPMSVASQLTPNHVDLVRGVVVAQVEIERSKNADVEHLCSLAHSWGEKLKPSHEPKTSVGDIRQSRVTETVINIVILAKNNFYRSDNWKALSQIAQDVLSKLIDILKEDDPYRRLYDDLMTDSQLALDKPYVEDGEDSADDDECSEETSDSSNRHDPPHYPKSKYNPYRMNPYYNGYDSPNSESS